MRKLLIADVSEPYTQALEEIFRNEFELRICHDGESALELLHTFRPDALILNFMLPFQDGLTVLQKSAYTPSVILAIAPYTNAYIEHSAADLGVQYIMIMPTVDALRIRLLDLLNTTTAPSGDLAGQTVVHLHTLGLHTHLDGYRQMCVGIPIIAANPSMRLTKELYPAIAEYFDLPDSRTVEHSIRKAIQSAWAKADPLVWAKYFPLDANGRIHCPTNKAFLCRVAELLK